MSATQLVVLVVAVVSAALALLSRSLGRQQRASRPPLERLRAEDLVAAGASERVADLVAAGHTIDAIKAYRAETGAGLREAKAAVDGLRGQVRTRRLIEAGASQRVARLITTGDTIGAIKAYRQESGVGLREAKDFVLELARLGA